MQEDQTRSDSGKVHVSLAGPNLEHIDDEFLATAYPKVHQNLKLITDERVIKDNPESHSGSKVVDESDSTIPDPSHQTVTSTPPVIAPITDFSSLKPSSLFTPPPINTEATNYFANHHISPRDHSIHRPSAKSGHSADVLASIKSQVPSDVLEQEMSEVKKTDHSADVLASIKSQVPTVVDFPR
ncbi:hypothetical protein Tco_1425100 [Tanacetum coccineum]